MKNNEPDRDISDLSFEQLVRARGKIIAAAFHESKKKTLGTALGIPGLRASVRATLGSAAAEGES